MTTIKLTPTQKRLMLVKIVKHKIAIGHDILPYVGRNLGDFNYETLYNELRNTVPFSREINKIFMDAKYGKHIPSLNKTKTKDSKKYSKLTEMEAQVFDYLLDSLDDWIGSETYSPEATEDIQEFTKIPAKKLRGVLSSLEQKNILHNYETDISENFHKEKMITLWLFTNQDETSREELIALVK